MPDKLCGLIWLKKWRLKLHHRDVTQLGRTPASASPPSRPMPDCLGAPNGVQIAQEPGVDPAQARPRSVRQAVGARKVLREDGGGQAVAVGVDFAHTSSVSKGLMAAIRFFGHHGGGLGQASPDGGLHPGAVVSALRHDRDAAAGDDGGAFVWRFCTGPAPWPGVLLISGPILVSWSKGPDLHGFGALFQGGDHFLKDRALHVHALGAQADFGQRSRSTNG